MEWEYYSVKSKCHTLKYELAVTMDGSNIIWINGPYKGSVHDLKIARDKLCDHMKEGEKGLADKGYIGDIHFLCPFKPARTESETKFNSKHYSIRQIIERINARLKKFQCLKQIWRSDLNKHFLVFYCVCYIVQIQLHESPLTKIN